MMTRLREARVTAISRATSIALMLLLVCATSLLAGEPKFPQLTGRVVDDAGVLNDSTKSQLTDVLAAHEKATGEQVVVVTLPSLQGYPIEDFGYQLGRHWGIGQKATNTGALVIVAPKEHKTRIEVGYGLEGKLTDAASRVIIERDMLPAIRRGDFNAGVLAGTSSVLAVLGGNAAAAEPTPAASAPQGDNDPAWLPLLVLFFILFIFYITHRGRRIAPFIYTMGGGWGGRGFGGGSSGGDSFSGGGGSFGGGGASGSW